MDVSLWARWMTMHGVPRAFMATRAVGGDPFARFLIGDGAATDQHRLTARLRAGGRLVRTPYVWVSVDHALTREILRDNRFGITPPSGLGLPGPFRRLVTGTDPGVANPVEPPAMVAVDPPDHTRYRKSLAHGFTPRAIEGLTARVAEITAELLEDIRREPRPDLIGDFARRLPVAIIAELLDLPVASHARLLGWGRSAAPLLDVGISWRSYRGAIAGLRDADDYFHERFELARSDPNPDKPFSQLAVDGELTRREFTANAVLLVGAGFETTVNLIGNGIVALCRHPEQLNRLREDATLWPNAIEEILRIDSPVQMTARTPRCDVEIAGARLSAGDTVALLLGGANRDPKVFDDPAAFDVGRSNARDHLAFASGIHACLGAALARIEGVTALRALFEAFPDLRLDGTPARRGLVNLRGFDALPARLGTRSSAATSA